jgi:hypothetical protein
MTTQRQRSVFGCGVEPNMNAQYPTIDDGKIIEPFGW